MGQLHCSKHPVLLGDAERFPNWAVPVRWKVDFSSRISSLEKDGFSNSSFAAVSATQRDGAAQLSLYNQLQHWKNQRGFHTSRRDLQKNFHCFFQESLQVNNYPRLNLSLPNLHSHFWTARARELWCLSEAVHVFRGSCTSDNSPVHPPNTAPGIVAGTRRLIFNAFNCW